MGNKWLYEDERSIEYQPNAGQTWLPAEENTFNPYIDFTPAPDPKEPLPITLTMKQEFADMGFEVTAMGRQEFLPGVTSEMMDWFWANMEKCYYLWAPGEHKSFRWMKSPAKYGFMESAHEIVEPAGGTPVLMRIRISRLDPEKWYPFTECLDHMLCEGIYNEKGELNDATIHLWQDVEGGCIHITCAVANKNISVLPDCIQKLEADMGAFLAANNGQMPKAPDDRIHAEFESAMWPVFLPKMYDLWKNHPDPTQNIHCNLTVEQTAEGNFRYIAENGPVALPE